MVPLPESYQLIRGSKGLSPSGRRLSASQDASSGVGARVIGE